jgi:UDP:flavonoid glycosyltransferase YjiC (YdhE family)
VETDPFRLRAIVNKKRRHLGLRPVRDAWRHVLGDFLIVASDPALGPVPFDLDMDYVQTGYFQLQQEGELGRDLEAFLAAGSPPVYIGFGSMPSEDSRKMTQILMDAAEAAEVRLVLSKGWAELGSEKGREIQGADCFFVGNVPHSKLFPRVAAVVHHGGAGTTATAARAGVPQILVPHVLDQYYWAERVYRAGVGPKPVWRTRMNAERLAAAIKETLSDRKIRERAREVSRILDVQEGLETVVRLIESEFSKRSGKASGRDLRP